MDVALLRVRPPAVPRCDVRGGPGATRLQGWRSAPEHAVFGMAGTGLNKVASSVGRFGGVGCLPLAAAVFLTDPAGLGCRLADIRISTRIKLYLAYRVSDFLQRAGLPQER